jgi:transposase
MYIRKTTRIKDGKIHDYWALIESYRTPKGPRQRTVAWLGELDKAGRLGIEKYTKNNSESQQDLFKKSPDPEWVEVNVNGIRVENIKDFGGPWLCLEIIRRLHLEQFFEKHIPKGRELIPWSTMAQVLVICRLCNPSSELHIAEHLFEETAFSDLLGIPLKRINEDRLYRALDKLLPHKDALEIHLKAKAGSLFNLDYDLFLYDVTSTYFEGLATGNPLAQRGYSRDHRGDCKQVCLGLVVTRDGFPLGYEVFAGNRADVTTVEDIVEVMESKYGKANRIWVMDRGMASSGNFEYLNEGGRKYIIGANRGELKQYEAELLKEDWQTVHTGLEVKQVDSPDGEEVFILCRSSDRAKKEKSMHDRFEQRIEESLIKMSNGCKKRRYQAKVLERRVGKLLGKNSRAAGLFDVKVEQGENGGATVSWTKRDDWRDWSRLSEGCYMLRSNVRDWSPEELWKAYIQLTEAEEAFRIQKNDLRIRPIWHQKEERVLSHILVCFLAYVLWKTLEGLCRQAGLGDEPRKVFHELSQIKLTDVVLPTRNGKEIRLRCVGTPTKHQLILLERLKLVMPKRFLNKKM